MMSELWLREVIMFEISTSLFTWRDHRSGTDSAVRMGEMESCEGALGMSRCGLRFAYMHLEIHGSFKGDKK